MSVLIETSLGEIVIDLHTKECPKATLNFLKLCKIKYYNNCLFFDVQKDYLGQAGDPENTGKGGNSIFGIIDGERQRYFKDEFHPLLRHNKLGVISTANFGPDMNTSTFFIQLTEENLSRLNDRHTVFGQVEEGFEVLEKMNKIYVDKNGRPYQNIRIKHTIVLDDPFEDPPGLIIPSESPEPVRDLEYNRLEEDFNIDAYYKDKETEEKVKERLQEHEAKNRSLVLEMLEDLPDADIKPPENVLFVCKLNPVTQDDDLELIFSRFGPIKSCQIIRDWKTGESLRYAFIEFEKTEDCERAYFSMNGVVIDERRIKVDFSQSVSKLWKNIKSNQRFQEHLDPKKEMTFHSENTKYEIMPHKNFATDKKDYNLIFEKNQEEKETSPKRKRHRSRDRKRSLEDRDKQRGCKRSQRSRSRSKKHRRHRSRSHEKRRY